MTHYKGPNTMKPRNDKTISKGLVLLVAIIFVNCTGVLMGYGQEVGRDLLKASLTKPAKRAATRFNFFGTQSKGSSTDLRRSWR